MCIRDSYKFEDLLPGAVVSSVNTLAIVDTLEVLDKFEFALFYDKSLIISNYSKCSKQFETLLTLHAIANLKNGVSYRALESIGSIF